MKRNFENPSLLWRLEDTLKNLFGEQVIYSPYVSAFQLKGNEKILDFGCGSGIGSRCIVKRLSKAGQLTCVDVSAFWISKAKRRLKNFRNVEFKVGDVIKLDIPDSSYDVISVCYVLHDIEPPLRQATINCLSRKLKPEGRIYINEPTKISHGIHPAEILSLMSEAGLSVIFSKEKKSFYTAGFYKIVKT